MTAKTAARSKNPLRVVDTWWTRIAALATIVMGTIGDFWVPPPPELTTTDMAFDPFIKPFAKFVITMLMGLLILPMVQWCCKREHARKWIKVVLAALAAAILAFFSYQYLLGKWTVESGGKRYYVGWELKEETQQYIGFHKDAQPRELLQNAEWNPLNVWTERSLRRRHLGLSAIYVLCAPIFAIGMLATAQLIYCATSKEDEPKVKAQSKSSSREGKTS
jgi:hypothetical protein